MIICMIDDTYLKGLSQGGMFVVCCGLWVVAGCDLGVVGPLA